MIINNSLRINKKDVEFLRALCSFSFAHHGLRSDNTTIVIEDSIDRANVAETTVVEDSEGFKVQINYNYEVGDNRLTFMEAIAHESTHAQQFHSKRLQYTLLYNNSGQVFWGFSWEGTAFQAPNTPEQYYNAPWEVEAFEETPVVVNGFLRQYGIDSFSPDYMTEVAELFA